ncbi:MAG: HAMP domain-containing protein [Spirochaetaceae bacterium]|jgi:adenylate cyclase|nr:HAMP domain-containing protein [Spirochaetaceae bacterium]
MRLFAGKKAAAISTNENTPERTPDAVDEQKKDALDSTPKIRRPIIVKLIGIITVMLGISLAAITAMVSILVSADVRLTAEDNNFSINRRNASSALLILNNIRSTCRIFLFNISKNYGLDDNTSIDDNEKNAAMFFAENPEIVCVGVFSIGDVNNAGLSESGLLPDTPETDASSIEAASLPEAVSAAGGATAISPPRILHNEAFFTAHNITLDMIQSYLKGRNDIVLRAAAGEAVTLNASPDIGSPLIVMFFSIEPRTVAAVFIPASIILNSFGSGAHTSFLINDTGDVLVHPDNTLVSGGANLRREPFIQSILGGSEQNIQARYMGESGEDYITAHQKINLTSPLDSGSVFLVTIISNKDVLAGIVATARRNIILGVAVLILSVLMIALFSRTLSKPLRLLTSASHQIETGNYNLKLEVKSKDEIGVLTESFIGMGHSIENFERFTNKALVRLAREGLLKRTGVNKKITVCFAFIRDFPEITEGLKARTVVEFVNDYLERVVPCISGTGGIVDKFLTQGGVVIMAVWGAAESSGSAEQDALNCVRACLMMRIALFDLNDERYEKFWARAPIIKMGCGINSGEVVVGQMGSEERMEYTVIGDTVNLAARLEGPNELFDTDILISENTKNLVGDLILTSEMPSLEVKGKEEPLRVFSVVNMADVSDSVNLFEEYRKIENIENTQNIRRKIQALSLVANLDQLRSILTTFGSSE